MQIAGRSMMLAAVSCCIATLLFLPLGSIIHFNQFHGKRVVLNVIQTLYSVPTVAVGLFVFVFISNAGPFGSLGLLFTPAAIIIGQVILIAPVITGLTISALSGVDRAVNETAVSLGASRTQAMVLVTREARFAILAALTMGFGRAVSEVGVSLMVGGNIRGFTRTFTTAISLETSRGDLELSLALGMILVFLALGVNIIMNQIQHRKE
ncbi:MAG: ABC transporter permease [Dehalococcoidia bacterium]|nr:ABC transporter permease [Dehalococcoidia bacterium]